MVAYSTPAKGKQMLLDLLARIFWMIFSSLRSSDFCQEMEQNGMPKTFLCFQIHDNQSGKHQNRYVLKMRCTKRMIVLGAIIFKASSVVLCFFFGLLLVGDCGVRGAIQDHYVNKPFRGGGSTGGVASQTPSSSSSSAAGILGTVGAVYDLIDRVLKDPKAKDSICLRIVNPEGGRSSSSHQQKQQQQPQQQQQQHEKKDQSNDERLWFHLEQQERTRYQFDAGERDFGCRERREDDLDSDLDVDLDVDLDLHTSNTMIVVTATSASELTAGLGYYFKHYCNFTLEWSTGGRAGGSHIVLPEVWPVPLEHDKKTILRYRTTKWRCV